MNTTPSGERIHIGFFGLRNVGKSSLVNAVTNQEMSVVSDVLGTTTDPVKKAMELLPLGPVVIIDTPGFDDEGALGEKRVAKTKEILQSCDIAVLVTSAQRELLPAERELLSIIQQRGIPHITVKNKADLADACENPDHAVYTSAVRRTGIEELKNRLGDLAEKDRRSLPFLRDLITPGEPVVLVTPIDSSAPKGRMILPQQMAIREVLDGGGIAVVTKETELKKTLAALESPPQLAVTDSQVFAQVGAQLPETIPLTSFSILMARHKGFLKTAVKGASAIDALENGARILIAEGCTHHRQCEDIGTVKFPRWLRDYTGKDLAPEWSSGNGFPEDLSGFDLVIHCGGCMLTDKEIQRRMRAAEAQDIPFTNYGTAIAHMNGILKRSLAPIPEIKV